MPLVQPITPCLWFDDQAEEAAKFHVGAGGDPAAQQCGWLKDRYRLSWQVFPQSLLEMITNPDAAKAQRDTEAMLAMKKIDIAALRRACAG